MKCEKYFFFKLTTFFYKQFSNYFNYRFFMRGKSYKKQASKRVILFCNPNGLSYEYLIFGNCILDIFLENNIDVCIWNYRGYGQRPGTPDFTNMNQEAEKIINYLEKTENYKSIGLYGYSLGGSVACNIAKLSKKINLLICDRTFSSLENIVKTRLNYSFVKILLKIFFINDTANHECFYDLNNEAVHKLIICDYNDEVINMDASVKRGLEFKIKNEIIAKEIKRIFSKNKEKENKISENFIASNADFNNNFSDIIRNKCLFTNVELENFKYDLQKMIKFMNEKEIGFVTNEKEEIRPLKEENKEEEKKEFEFLLNKKYESEINKEKVLRLKSILREFFYYFSKESRYFDLINGYSTEINHKNFEMFINVNSFFLDLI